MHRNFVSVTSVLRHPSSYSRITWTRTNTQSNPNTSTTHINVEKYRMTDTRTHIQLVFKVTRNHTHTFCQ